MEGIAKDGKAKYRQERQRVLEEDLGLEDERSILRCMKQGVWGNIGRGLLVLPAFVLSLVAAYAFLMFSILLDQVCLRWMQASDLRLPPSGLLKLLDTVFFVVALAIWAAPTVFAIGFALRTRKVDRVQWGLSIAFLLATAYVWAKTPPGSVLAAHIAALSCAAVLVCGIALSFRVAHRFWVHIVTNAAALVILTLPNLVAIAKAPKQPPNAHKLWSTLLQKGTWQAMNTGSSFAATRQLVVSGERVLAIFDVGFAAYEGKQPMSKYRLVSLDVKTGEIKNTQEFVGRWGAMPYLFATNDGHVILENGSLRSLNFDLTDAGPQFTADRGLGLQISPDGSTLAWETLPGTTLLDSRTLTPTGKPLVASAPVSISAAAELTDNTSWSKYPKDRSFVTLTDEHGERLLFHGECGAQPRFLNNETVMLVGCGKMWTLNLQGTILNEAAVDGGPQFAGVSRDGQRFALEFSDEKGDPSILLYEYFLVFDVATLRPVAMVRISEMPERQSWSSFSSDGRYFAAGNPNALSLYQLP